VNSRKLGFGLGILAVLIAPANAAPLPRYGIFAFSNACWEEESGDAAGNRALLIRNGDGDRLTWEWSGGPMEGPVPATALSIDAKSGRISFDVDIGSGFGKTSDGTLSQEPPYIVHFIGRISDNVLAVRNTSAPASSAEAIPRTRNFAAKTSACRPARWR
jgi:hypothetical protein